MIAVGVPVERRKFQRVLMVRPLAGTFAGARVYVLDASVSGLRIAHQGTVPPLGGSARLTFSFEDHYIELECQVVRNALHKLAKKDGEKSIYHAGLAITATFGQSDVAMRQMIATLVARALDEQKANARGIPAKAALSYQTGKGTEFIRCELIGTSWRKTETTRPDQPANGFTISAEQSREEIEMLCEAYATGDADGRRLIKTMAELSISKAEGIPTRKYMP